MVRPGNDHRALPDSHRLPRDEQAAAISSDQVPERAQTSLKKDVAGIPVCDRSVFRPSLHDMLEVVQPSHADDTPFSRLATTSTPAASRILRPRVKSVGDSGQRLTIARRSQSGQELAPKTQEMISIERGQNPPPSGGCARFAAGARPPLVARSWALLEIGCDSDGSVPCPGTSEVADAEARPAQVVTAASALAFSGLPAKCKLLERLAAEERRRHADMPRIVPVLPFPGHLSGTVRAQGGESVPALQSLNEPPQAPRPSTTSSSRNITHGEVPSVLARFLARDRLIPIGVLGCAVPSMRWMRTSIHLNLDSPPDIFARRRKIATE